MLKFKSRAYTATSKPNPVTVAVTGFVGGAADGNRTHEPHPYQGCALPTELQQHLAANASLLYDEATDMSNDFSIGAGFF